MMRPQGIVTALVTPFDGNGDVDYSALDHLLDYQLEAGVHGLFVCGSTGEAYSLESDEVRLILRRTVARVGGRMAIYCGVSGNCTRAAVTLTRVAQDEGADGVTALTPFFVPPAGGEMLDYFGAIAAATDLPVLLYNHPLRIGRSIPVEVVAELAEISNVVGMKDSSGDLAAGMAYMRAAPSLALLSGNDNLICSLMQFGASGAVAASANFIPDILLEIYAAVTAGDWEKAAAAQLRVMPVRQAFGIGTYPAMVKAALRLIGIEVGSCRHPVADIAGEQLEELRQLISELRT